MLALARPRLVEHGVVLSNGTLAVRLLPLSHVLAVIVDILISH